LPSSPLEYMEPFVDPRRGDVEDDASSTKKRTLLSLAGSVLAEISVPKLIVSWFVLIVFPAFVLGFAPLVVSAWIEKVSGHVRSPLNSFWPILFVLLLVAIGLVASKTLFRFAESGFWSLNSVVIEPTYVICREGLRHAADKIWSRHASARQMETLRAASSAVAGLVVCAVAMLVFVAAWPASHWRGDLLWYGSASRLATVALANSLVIVSLYLAAAALVWAFADTTMPQPRDLDDFSSDSPAGRSWRVAHLSDVHVVGETYGFRIEGGRSGPQGNERLKQAFASLDPLCQRGTLDLVLITGDITDAGTSAEWAELLDSVARHPFVAQRMLLLPGNHDVNIVDSSNPARLDTPISPNKTLRKIRTLSVLNAIQGGRVRVVDRRRRCLGPFLSDALEPQIPSLTRFADQGRPRMVLRAVAKLWASVFPMVLPPEANTGLGVILLNSNADTHFSFTNALGLVSTQQVHGLEIAMGQYPGAAWVIALHHHVVEYPQGAHALSERLGTALINGNWFLRRIRPLSSRSVIMHGHRHIDWIGQCGGHLIVSAPSPVMGGTDALQTHFCIQTLCACRNGPVQLQTPARIVLNGRKELVARSQPESGRSAFPASRTG